MKTKNIGLMAILFTGVLLTAGCSKDEVDDFYSSHPDAVRINATIGEKNSRVTTEEEGSAWMADDVIAILANDGEVLEYEQNEAGDAWIPVNSIYLKWTAKEISFKAYHPATSGTSFNAFTLPTDQSDVTKLRAADYMTAEALNCKIETDKGAVSLVFKHRLAKVTVNVVVNSDEYPKGGTISDMKFRSAVSGYTGGVVTGSPLWIVTCDRGNNTYTALVTPSSATPDEEFIQFSLNPPGGTMENLKVTGIPEFKAGKAYSLTLYAGHDGVKVGNVSVESWGTDENMAGGSAVNLQWDGSMPSITPTYAFSGGNGAEDAPYLIHTATDFVQFAVNVNGITDYSSEKHFLLGADLDLKDHPWTSIGNFDYEFTGTFDGGQHTISGLYINSPEFSIGLFGSAKKNAVIKNIHVAGNIISTGAFIPSAGGICGLLNDGMISGCSSSVTIKKTDGAGGSVGGICGTCNGGTIVACLNTGSLSLSVKAGMFTNVGGVCGKVDENEGVPGKIIACVNRADLQNNAIKNGSNCSAIGGICGENARSSTITACYNTGKLTASEVTTMGSIYGYTNNNVVACFIKEILNMDIDLGDGVSVFLEGQWPSTTDSPEWGVGDGSSSGKYWKTLGSWNEGTPDYPRLWWETGK